MHLSCAHIARFMSCLERTKKDLLSSDLLATMGFLEREIRQPGNRFRKTFGPSDSYRPNLVGQSPCELRMLLLQIPQCAAVSGLAKV